MTQAGATVAAAGDAPCATTWPDHCLLTTTSERCLQHFVGTSEPLSRLARRTRSTPLTHGDPTQR